MTKKELRKLASEVARNEIILRDSNNQVEKDKAADEIEAIVNKLHSLDEILELDVEVQNILKKS